MNGAAEVRHGIEWKSVGWRCEQEERERERRKGAEQWARAWRALSHERRSNPDDLKEVPLPLSFSARTITPHNLFSFGRPILSFGAGHMSPASAPAPLPLPYHSRVLPRSFSSHLQHVHRILRRLRNQEPRRQGSKTYRGQRLSLRRYRGNLPTCGARRESYSRSARSTCTHE